MSTSKLPLENSVLRGEVTVEDLYHLALLLEIIIFSTKVRRWHFITRGTLFLNQPNERIGFPWQSQLAYRGEGLFLRATR